MGNPKRRYINSDKTDIAKTFKAARKKILRDLEAKRRREVAELKRIK
jgi:hypothetical protein